MSTWYVNAKTGVDDAVAVGQGTTASQPFKSLSFLTSRTTAPMTAAGDTIYIAPGFYPETVTFSASGTSAAPINILGDPSGVSTNSSPGPVCFYGFVPVSGATPIAPKATGFDLSSKSWLIIKNIQFDGYVTGIKGLTATYIEVNNCKFTNCQYGIWSSDVNSSGMAAWVIKRCEFRTCLYGVRVYYPTTLPAAIPGHTYWSVQNSYLITECTFDTISTVPVYLVGNVSYPLYNPLITFNRFIRFNNYAVEVVTINASLDSNLCGIFGNTFEQVAHPTTTTNPIYMTYNTGSMGALGNALHASQVMGSNDQTTLINGTPGTPTGPYANLSANRLCYNTDSNLPNASSGGFGLFLEKGTPLQGTASGKLYAAVPNWYRWRIPADQNQALGIMLTAKRSWATMPTGGSVVFKLYDEHGKLAPLTATLQDDNFQHFVTIDKITMPYKGFAILEVFVTPRSDAVLGDNVLIDDIQII